MPKQVFVHDPELSLGGGGFGRLGGTQGMRMDRDQREVAEDEAQLATELLLQGVHGGERHAGVGALIVAVEHQCQRSIVWPLYVVAVRYGRRQLDSTVISRRGFLTLHVPTLPSR